MFREENQQERGHLKDKEVQDGNFMNYLDSY
jgi:hypothetical protein